MLIISPASRGLCHSNTAVVLLSLLTRRSRSSPSEDGLPFLKISDAPDRFTVEAEKLQTELQVRMMRLSKLTSIISISCISYNAFGGKTELRTWQFCKWDAPLCFLLLSKPRRETRRREDDKTVLSADETKHMLFSDAKEATENPSVVTLEGKPPDRWFPDVQCFVKRNQSFCFRNQTCCCCIFCRYWILGIFCWSTKLYRAAFTSITNCKASVPVTPSRITPLFGCQMIFISHSFMNSGLFCVCLFLWMGNVLHHCLK